MNKSQIRELLGDLKAAVRLGHPEAVEIALDDLRSLPVVAANDRLSEGFFDQVIRPAGVTLARLPTNQLLPLLEDPLAALRAVGAVALAHDYLTGKDVDRRALLAPAKDPRPEVRTALGGTLREVGEAYPEHLLHLLDGWLRDSSPKVRSTALTALPALTQSRGEGIIALIEPLNDDESSEVRAALVDALQAIAQGDLAESVLGLLADWGAESRPNVWVITRALSGSWAASHPKAVEAILRTLHSKVRKTKEITNALRALERHGANIEIDS
ncbi:MAG: HEAT repeat domain-containing protein [Anaerolineales bacterium]|nr:HEAT repeat domain-containing protein [Anaerolineales bacterium]